MQIEEFQRALKTAEDIWGLWEVCRQYSERFGLRRYYYAHLPPVGAPDENDLRFRAEGLDPETAKEYFRSGYYNAVKLLEHAKAHPHPFYWDELPQNTSDQIVVGEQKNQACVNGMCIPVFGPNGRNGVACFELPEGISRLCPETLQEMQWSAQLAHVRYCELWVPELGPRPRLTPRERQVLVWVARGKSNPLIAEILGISAHTVDAHLRRIFVKLGVFDRITAAVRAISVGLISGGVIQAITQRSKPFAKPEASEGRQ
ncbi:MAG: LuxR C-terminal-related transcriptional regulator [Pseudomonadota bacterium]